MLFEYPIPGAKAYAETMDRLKDPRVLEMLSSASLKSSNKPERTFEEWMQVMSDQNAKLLREMK